MELTTSQIQFIKDHATDDLTRLLLSAAKYPGMDIPFSRSDCCPKADPGEVAVVV
mgnify:CR=1 FL=1